MQDRHLQYIVINNDNIELLGIVKYLLNIVVNDIEQTETNDMKNDNDFYMGNYTHIKKEDLESIVSIIDTISDVEDYNS